MKLQNAKLPISAASLESVTRQAPQPSPPVAADDFHLSELVRSLRSLVPDSPERQERLEQIARDYAGGVYKVNVEATASKIIDDGLRFP